MRIDPTMNKHVGPAPYGGGLQLLPVLLDWVTKPTESGNRRIVVHLSIKASALIPILDLIEGDQDSAALTPLLKYFTGLNPFFLLCVKMGGKMLQLPSWSGEFGTYLIELDLEIEPTFSCIR